MSDRPLDQKTRVLRAAWRYPRGITRTDFMLPDVCDGGDPILNFPARIKELRDDGIVFHERGRRDRCKVFVLDRASIADATKPPGPAVPSSARDNADDDDLSSGDWDNTQEHTDGPGGSTTTLFTLGLELARAITPPPPPPRSAINDDLDDAA